jgi:hypothetical protein
MRRFVILVAVLGMVLQTGCSPDVASPDTKVGVSPQETSVGQPATEPSPSNKGLRIERDLRGMGPEEVNETLAGMQPQERTEVVLRFLSFTLLFYYSVYNHYPTAEEGLDILLNPPPAPTGKVYEPFARDVLLIDGWQRKVQYQPVAFPNGLPGFKLRSLGPDGVESGDDVPPDVENLTIEVTATIAAGGLDEIKQPGQ